MPVNLEDFTGKISRGLWGNQQLVIAKSKLSQGWVGIGKNYDYWRWVRAIGLEKVGFIFIPKKGNEKECSNYCSIALISHINFPGGSDSKASAYNVGDLGSIPGLEDLLEKGIATHSSILAWKISWAEEPGRLSSMGFCKESDTIERLHFTSHISKIMYYILQARFQVYMNWELSEALAGFRKRKGIRDQNANIHWIIEGASEFQKTSASLTMQKPLTIWITANCGKLFNRWEYQITWLLRNLYTGEEATVRTRHGKMQGFKIGKAVHQGFILSPCLFNLYAKYITQNAGLDEAQAGRLPGEISIT